MNSSYFEQPQFRAPDRAPSRSGSTVSDTSFFGGSEWSALSRPPSALSRPTSSQSHSSSAADFFSLDTVFSSRPSSAGSYTPQGNMMPPSESTTNPQPKYPPGLPMPATGRQGPFPNAPAAPFGTWPYTSEPSRPGKDFPPASQGLNHRAHPYSRRPSVSSSGFDYAPDSMNRQPNTSTSTASGQFSEFYSICTVPPAAQPFVEMSLQWAEGTHYKRVQALYDALRELTAALEMARRGTPLASVTTDSGRQRLHHVSGPAQPPEHISTLPDQPPTLERLTVETLIHYSKYFAPGPPTRPGHLKEAVIYTRSQAKELAYGNNEGKVIVKRVLREADGSNVSDDVFRSLMDYGRHVAYLLYQQKSPKAPEDAIRGVNYVKAYHRTLWNGSIALLEYVCPPLTYCQGSMKAQAVLGVSLDWWRRHDEELIRRRQSSKPTSHSLDPPSQARRITSSHVHQVSRNQIKDKGKARDPGPSQTASKRDSSVLSPIRYAGGAKRNRHPTPETATSEDFSEAINVVSDEDDDLDNDIANTTARPAAPPSPSPSPGLPPSPPPPSPMSNAIDLSWIEVSATYDGLLVYLDAQEVAKSHLDAVSKEIIQQVRQVVINFGRNRLFQHGIPDANTSALLRTMLDTDTLMVDEDNDNRQWGHSHYKSGIDTTLLTWGSVGSVDVAFKLLAAGLRISACARHICYKRRIHISADSALIADVYLERLTLRLVHVWQKADGPMGGFTAPFVAPSLLPQPSGLPLPPRRPCQIPIHSPQPSRPHGLGLGHVLTNSGTFGPPELLLPSDPTGIVDDNDDDNDMAVDDDTNSKLREELDVISMPDCRLILQGLGLTPPKSMKKPAFIEYVVKLVADQDAETSSQLIAGISSKAMSKSKATAVSRPKPRRIMPPVTQMPPVFSPRSVT